MEVLLSLWCHILLCVCVLHVSMYMLSENILNKKSRMAEKGCS